MLIVRLQDERIFLEVLYYFVTKDHLFVADFLFVIGICSIGEDPRPYSIKRERIFFVYLFDKEEIHRRFYFFGLDPIFHGKLCSVLIYRTITCTLVGNDRGGRYQL